MPLTAWAATQSDGTIDDTPARAFQYRWNILYDLNFSDDDSAGISMVLAAMGGFTLVPGLAVEEVQGVWKLRVVIPAGTSSTSDLADELEEFLGGSIDDFGDWGDWLDGDKDTTIFEQTVTLTFRVTALVNSIVGMVVLSLFVWELVDEEISTTVCGRPLSGPAPTIGGEFGYADPASGEGYSNSTGTIDCVWYSPIYRLYVPSGARVVVDYHNVGVSETGLDLLSVQTRVLRACMATAHCTEQGMSWVAQADAQGLRIESLNDDNTPGPFSGRIGQGSGATWLMRFPNSTRLGCLTEGFGAAIWHLSTSEGAEGTWEQMATITEAGELWAAGLMEDASGLVIIAKPAGVSELHCVHALFEKAGAISWNDLGAVDGLEGLEPGAVIQTGRGKLHLVSAGTASSHYYVSRDGGITWQ